MMDDYPTYNELPELLSRLTGVVSIGNGTERTWTFAAADPMPEALSLDWVADSLPIDRDTAERLALARVLAALEAAGFHEVRPQ